MPSPPTTTTLLLSLSLLPFLLPHSTAQYPPSSSPSPKRGLIFISTTPTSSQDSSTWSSSTSDLTWYYNYSPTPTSQYASSPKLQFVPMLFGAPNPSDTPFNQTVSDQISAGANISAVLSFNEPDGSSTTGGSSVSPSAAAAAWISQVAPLKAKGVRLGGPAVTSAQSGFSWLSSFFAACGGKCVIDFLPLHFYGNFEGLASYIGQVRAAYPNTTLWVTEFGDPNAGLSDTQDAFNQSVQYLDRLDYVERYSYFGSFRSSVSNVGPNEAMLDQNGQLTDIGAWYLGGPATGNIPGAASSISRLTAWSIAMVAISTWVLW